MNIYDFPAEILINILIQAEPLDVAKCRQVCRFFKGVIDESSVLKYHVALYLASYVDGPVNNHLSTAERLRKLENHQESWKSLQFQRKDSYVIDKKASTYELYGGVYAQGTAEPGGIPYVTRGMELIEFPSLLRDEEEARTWKIKDMGVDVKDFGMDPEKNLLVLLVSPGWSSVTDQNPPVTIHLRTLRTTDPVPHPLASQPILSHRLEDYCPSHYFWVQIVGDRLGVLMLPMNQDHGVMSEMAIWDWQTGKLDGVLRFGGDVKVASFSFISYDTFMAPCVVKGKNSGRLRLYQVTRAQDAVPPTLLAEYLLPSSGVHSLQRALTCRSDPAPWTPPSRNPMYKPNKEDEEAARNDPRKPRPPPPFFPAPKSRVVVLSLCVLTLGGRGGHLQDYTIFVKSETLLHEWKKHVADPLDGVDGAADEPPEIRWNSWGPDNTRWVREKTSEDWVCYVYGQRYCRVYPTPNHETGLQLMDFNEISFTQQEPTLDHEEHVDPIAEDPVQHHSAGVEVIDADTLAEEDEDDEEWVDEDDEDEDDANNNADPFNITYKPGVFVITKPSVIYSNAFTEPVESRLPFRLTRVEGPDVNNLQRVLIDNERVIGVRSSRGTRRSLNLDVLTM